MLKKLISSAVIASLVSSGILINLEETGYFNALAVNEFGDLTDDEYEYDDDYSDGDEELLDESIYDDLVWENNLKYGLIRQGNLATVIGCRDDIEDVAILTTIQHNGVQYCVNAIGGCSFAGCNMLKQVTIHNNIKNIGNKAFADCIGLTSITIPDSVESIGIYAFGDCQNLETIEIPNSVLSIGDSAFEYCFSLREVRLSDRLENIYKKTFKGCRSLEKITIPREVKYIGNEVFWGCVDLKEICFENANKLNREEINADILAGCGNLERIVVTGNVDRTIFDAINIPEGCVIQY